MTTIYVTIKVKLSDDADPEEVVSEMDYSLEHEGIVNTEVMGYEENG